jgi:hypothetical protein
MERILSILEDVLGELLCRLIMCIMKGEICSRRCARRMKRASSWFSIKSPFQRKETGRPEGQKGHVFSHVSERSSNRESPFRPQVYQ